MELSYKVCQLCYKVFTSDVALKTHYAVHESAKPYVCPVCGKRFSKLDGQRSHSMTHKERTKLKCQLCSKSFIRQSSLKAHQKTHSGKGLHPCPTCKRNFPSAAHLKQHLTTHTREKKFSCRICRKLFLQKSSLNYHYKIHTGEKPFTCDNCGQGFRVNSALQRHRLVHALAVPQTEASSSNEIIFSCEKITRSSKEIRSTVKQSFPCNECGKEFSRKADVHRHKRKFHIQVISTETISNKDTSVVCQDPSSLDTKRAQESVYLLMQPFTKDDNRVHNENLTNTFATQEFTGDFCQFSKMLSPRCNEELKDQKVNLICEPYQSTSTPKDFSKTVHDIQTDISGLSEETNPQSSLVNVNQQTNNETKDKKRYCEHCHKAFRYEYQLQIHKKVHKGAKPFKCLVCEKRFSTLCGQKKHSAMHESQCKKYQCPLCQKSFYRKGSLTSHQKTHSGQGLHTCSMCNKICLSAAHLKIHLLTHTGEKSHSCHICKKMFMHKSSLDYHLRIHTGEKPFPCNICGSYFRKKSVLEKHRLSHNREKSAQSSINTKGNQNYDTCEKPSKPSQPLFMKRKSNHAEIKSHTCLICGKTFSRSYTLKRHFNLHREKRFYTCKECNKIFTGKGDFVKHLLIHSTQKTSTETPMKKETSVTSHNLLISVDIREEQESFCYPIQPFTNDDSVYNENLNNVVSTQNIKNDFYQTNRITFPLSNEVLKDHQLNCGNLTFDPCQSIFTSKHSSETSDIQTDNANLTGKENSQTITVNVIQKTIHKAKAEKKVCELCHKAFIYSYQLKIHKRVHAGVKPFKCLICDKRFSTLCGQKIHSAMHESHSRKYQCQLCQKSFYRKGSLNSHQKTHTGLGLHTCTMCNKICLSAAHLKVHLLTHTGEKSHSCEICQKMFMHKSSLDYHLRIHTGEKPFPCDVCGSYFRKKSVLEKHKLSHNAEKSALPSKDAKGNPPNVQTCRKPSPSLFMKRQWKQRHKEKRSYCCRICEKMFSRKYSLNRHYKLHSANETEELEANNKSNSTLNYPTVRLEPLKLSENVCGQPKHQSATPTLSKLLSKNTTWTSPAEITPVPNLDDNTCPHLTLRGAVECPLCDEEKDMKMFPIVPKLERVT